MQAMTGCQRTQTESSAQAISESPPQVKVYVRGRPLDDKALFSAPQPEQQVGDPELTEEETPPINNEFLAEAPPQMERGALPQPASQDSNPNSQNTSPSSEEVLHSSDLDGIYENLIQGEFFHTIPKKMQVQQQLVIEAGVAEQVTEQLLSSLGITTPVTITEREKYNPLGVEIRLIDSEEAFEIEDISTGRKAVITGYPELWTWSVTPLKPGSHELQLEVEVSLDSNSAKRHETLILFEGPIVIQSNSSYRIRSAVDKYWLLLYNLFMIIIFGFGGWYIGARFDNRRHLNKGSLRSKEGE
ncbi:MAG: hypothetical protein AAFY20_07410 [Cyanobacteria bacterium J06639_14]